MVKAIVDIDKRANRMINLMKTEFDLKDKSQAINKMAEQLERFVDFEPRVRPEYVKRLRKIRKQKAIPISDFEKHFGLK